MFKNIILWFQNEIFLGKLKPGKKLRSRRFYEIKFGTTKKTIEKVFSTLKNLNFIYSIEKKGYFVNEIEKQNIFKSEKLLMDATNVEVFKKEFPQAFNFNEIKKLLGVKYKLNKKDFYCYYKIYIKNNKILKLSFAFNNKRILWDKRLTKDSFYLVFASQRIYPTKRKEWMRGGITYPDKINKMLGERSKKGVCLYVALFDKQNNLLHVTKQFLKQEVIKWDYTFEI